MESIVGNICGSRIRFCLVLSQIIIIITIIIIIIGYRRFIPIAYDIAWSVAMHMYVIEHIFEMQQETELYTAKYPR